MKRISSSLAILMALLFWLPANSQLLYKVEGNGLSKPSYVFGTHHLAPLSVIEKFGVKAPFEGAEQIVGELDMTGDPMQLAQTVQSHAIAPADSTLTKVISPEDFAVISKEFKNWAPMPQMELSMLDMMKPMLVTNLVAVTMAQKAMPDHNPAEQLDSWFQVTGKENGKKILPLETADQQAALLFDLTPISNQAKALVELLKDPEKAVASTQKLTDAYLQQDLDKMMQLSKEDDENPEFMIALLDKRNADWLTKLPAIFKEAPTFVAVGALHLAGDKGVIEGLRKLGYKVTPVK